MTSEKGLHVILQTLGAIFFKSSQIGRHFDQIIRDFAKVFTDFSLISMDFTRIFTKSKLLGVLLRPRILHHWL